MWREAKLKLTVLFCMNTTGIPRVGALRAYPPNELWISLREKELRRKGERKLRCLPPMKEILVLSLMNIKLF